MGNMDYQNLFVACGLAKQLKEKDFEEDCFAHYTLFGKRLIVRQTGSAYQGVILAPLYQQVIDWFEQRHGIEIKCYKVLPIDLNPIWVVELINWSSKRLGFANKFIDHGIPTLPVNHWGNKYEALNKAIEEALELI